MPGVENYHCVEVQELLGTIPRRIVRWGITTIFVIIVCILIGSYFVKYPETVTVPIVVFPLALDSNLIANTSGTIEELFVSNEDIVCMGDLIAILHNSGNNKTLLQLYNILYSCSNRSFEEIVNMNWNIDYRQLGEVQNSFYNFKQTFIELQKLKKTHIPKQETYIQLKKDFETNMKQLFLDINKWYNKYTIVANVSGKVFFTKNWTINQQVRAKEYIGTVISENNLKFVGQFIVPENVIGKVDIGQFAYIKLDDLPDIKYGLLKGRISFLSQIPMEGGYIGEINFSNKLITTNNKELPFFFRMNGSAKIVIKEQRLSERLFEPMKSLFYQ